MARDRERRQEVKISLKIVKSPEFCPARISECLGISCGYIMCWLLAP